MVDNIHPSIIQIKYEVLWNSHLLKFTGPAVALSLIKFVFGRMEALWQSFIKIYRASRCAVLDKVCVWPDGGFVAVIYCLVFSV